MVRRRLALCTLAALLAVAPRARAQSTADAGAPPGTPGDVDLLHQAGAVVAVSSIVSNATDAPSHLVDGHLDSAWNSRTGDLIGAWIAFRVPPGSEVHRVEILPGYLRQNRDGDLFTMNPRIARVRVSRDAQPLGEFDLDVGRRDLQTISVAGPAGDWRIEVLAIQPGTRRTWRETCVSELRVWGALPAGATAIDQLPPVRLGALDGPDAEALFLARATIRRERAYLAMSEQDVMQRDGWMEHDDYLGARYGSEQGLAVAQGDLAAILCSGAAFQTTLARFRTAASRAEGAMDAWSQAQSTVRDMAQGAIYASEAERARADARLERADAARDVAAQARDAALGAALDECTARDRDLAR